MVATRGEVVLFIFLPYTLLLSMVAILYLYMCPCLHVLWTICPISGCACSSVFLASVFVMYHSLLQHTPFCVCIVHSSKLADQKLGNSKIISEALYQMSCDAHKLRASSADSYFANFASMTNIDIYPLKLRMSCVVGDFASHLGPIFKGELWFIDCSCTCN